MALSWRWGDVDVMQPPHQIGPRRELHGAEALSPLMQGIAVGGAEGAQRGDGGSVGFGLMATDGEARIARALELRGGSAFLWRDGQDL
ncbi:MAG: hypothetical protein MJD61_00675, partial [Proteobacteria bacterium]|nr:hypothetical protein [Pseudomonadota bacterium]